MAWYKHRRHRSLQDPQYSKAGLRTGIGSCQGRHTSECLGFGHCSGFEPPPGNQNGTLLVDRRNQITVDHDFLTFTKSRQVPQHDNRVHPMPSACKCDSPGAAGNERFSTARMEVPNTKAPELSDGQACFDVDSWRSGTCRPSFRANFCAAYYSSTWNARLYSFLFLPPANPCHLGAHSMAHSTTVHLGLEELRQG